MKVEFNGNQFSAEIKDQQPPLSPMSAPFSINKNLGFILGCLALMTAFAEAGLGVLFNTVNDFLIFTFGFTTVSHLVFMLIVYIGVTLVSVTFGVTSIICYNKSKPKGQLNAVGFVFSIISFVACGLSLILNLSALIFIS